MVLFLICILLYFLRENFDETIVSKTQSFEIK